MSEPRRSIRKSRASKASVFVLLALVFALAGCSRSEVTDEPPRYVESGEDRVSQIGQGGTARIALPLAIKPECLNPYLPACSGSETLNGAVFEGLLSVGASGEHRKLLASGIPSYSDGTLSLEPPTIEVNLRENAAFSDGRSVTGEDVKWTYEQAARLADEGRVSPLYAGFRHVEEARVEGSQDRIVIIELDEPYSEWRDLLTAPVLPKHVYGAEYRDFETTDLQEDPVGSGPFRLDEFGGDGISFTANPRYWTEDELQFPRLDGLEVEYRGPPEARASLTNGQSDFGLFPDGRGPDSGDVFRDPGVGSRTEVLIFNSASITESERAALSDSLDREAVSETTGFRTARSLFGAYGTNVSTWSEPGTEPPDSDDLSGEELTLIYPSGGPARDRAVSEMVAGFEAVGASVEVRRLSRADFYGEGLATGDFDLAVFDVGSLASYEAFTPLLPESSASAVSESLRNVEDRGRALSQAQEIISDDFAMIPLYVWPDSYAWSSALYGPRPDTPARDVLWNVRDWGFFK